MGYTKIIKNSKTLWLDSGALTTNSFLKHCLGLSFVSGLGLSVGNVAENRIQTWELQTLLLTPAQLIALFMLRKICSPLGHQVLPLCSWANIEFRYVVYSYTMAPNIICFAPDANSSLYFDREQNSSLISNDKVRQKLIYSQRQTRSSRKSVQVTETLDL